MSTSSGGGGGGGGDGNGVTNPPTAAASAAALRADPSKHVAITAGSERAPVFFDAHLVAKHPASPTVVHLDFEIGAPSARQRIRGDPPQAAAAASNNGGGGGGDTLFGFKPGQWVDLYIPAIDAVGGFSMTSSCFGGAATPSGAHGVDGTAREAELPAPGLATATRRRVMSLAVKDSDHPPARFMFAASRVGDTFPVRVGGDVFLDPAAHCGHGGGGGGGSRPRGLVLVAGGIGITPLHSMLVSAFDAPQHLPSHAGGGAWASPPQVALLHSAKTAAELVFRPQVLQLARRFPGSLHTAYFVTGGGDGAGDGAGANSAPSDGNGGSGDGGNDSDDDCGELQYGRIDHRSLREALAFAARATAPPSADAAAAAPTDGVGRGQEADDAGKDEDGGAKERGRQRARLHGGGLGRRLGVVTAGAEPPLWYLCGPPPFLRGVEAVLQTELGVRPQDVRFERWW